MRVWSTDGLAAPDHFPFWREVICEAFAALDPKAPGRSGPFPSAVALDSFADVNVARIRSCAQVVRRGAEEIRIDPQDRLFVNLQLVGVGRVEQGDRAAFVPAGSFTVVDTARPYRLEFDGVFEVLSLRIPRERLLPFTAGADEILARPVDGRHGMGRFTTGFMRMLLDQPEDLASDQRADIATHLCDLIASATRRAVPKRLEGRELVRQRFVDAAVETLRASLADPDLGVNTLASRFGVSTRYVQQCFTEAGMSVTARIRELRLEACAHDLANRHDLSSIQAIAERWGFSDIPHFTRIFGRHFGCAPSSFRSRSRK
jgi:AraC-like DNA-binding protein